MSEWPSSINQQTTHVVEVVEEREPGALLVGLQIGTATVENDMVWGILKNLKIELPFDPMILLLRLYPKNPKHQK